MTQHAADHGERIPTCGTARRCPNIGRTAVVESNFEQLSDLLGFGWKHPGRPTIKDALANAETPKHTLSVVSKEGYDLAVKFCNQKGPELWPNTNGRHWPSWPTESELYVSFTSVDN